MVRVTALVLALSVAAGDAPKKDAKADTIEGTWNATAATVRGKKIDTAALHVAITFKDGKFVVRTGPRVVETGTYKVDATKKPAEIETVSDEGPDKGKPTLGIYELKGDRLKTAFGDAGKNNRPTAFDGSSCELSEFTRAADKK